MLVEWTTGVKIIFYEQLFRQYSFVKKRNTNFKQIKAVQNILIQKDMILKCW